MAEIVMTNSMISGVSDNRTPDDMCDLMMALTELNEHADQYKEAEQYYEGTVPEFFASARLRRRLEAGSKRFRVNLAKTPVNVVADGLSLNSVVCVDNPKATEALALMLKENEMDEEAPNLHRRTCEYGDSYLMIWPNEADDKKVDIFFNDPKNVRVIYDEENPRLARFAIKRFTNGNTVRVNLLYKDRIEKYYRDKDGADDKYSDWKLYFDDDFDDSDPEAEPSWPIENPYGQVPVFHFRTERPYGVPVHKSAYGPQDAVNKLIVTQMGSVDYQGYPQRYALTDPGSDTDETSEFDSTWEGDDASATKKTTDTSTLKSGPGEVWFMQGVKETGQYQVADPKVFTDPLAIMVRLMAQTTTTPLFHFDPSGTPPSGESHRRANKPINDKIMSFQRSFGGTWKSAYTFAMKLLGYEDVTVDVRWQNPAAVDDKDGWDLVAGKIAVGVPIRQALLEAGYIKEQLDAWGVPEIGQDANMTLKERALALLDIGKAAQALGAAVGFGVVDVAQVKALVDIFVTENTPPTKVVPE